MVNIRNLFLLSSFCVHSLLFRYFWGFSLTFSDTGSFFVGDFKFIVLSNVGGDCLPALSVKIPLNVFMIYQCMFAVITPGALSFLEIMSATANNRSTFLTVTPF
jgi:ammonia channel protein AmtB